MDTYFSIDSSKCKRCYKCIKLCSETYKDHGFLGFLTIDVYDGTPEYENDNCQCHHCDAIIDGQKTPYACRKICPNEAVKITRW